MSSVLLKQVFPRLHPVLLCSLEGTYEKRVSFAYAQGTHSRMRAAQKRLKGVLRRSGNCRSMCITIGLMVALAVLIVVAFKLAALF